MIYIISGVIYLLTIIFTRNLLRREFKKGNLCRAEVQADITWIIPFINTILLFVILTESGHFKLPKSKFFNTDL